MSRTITLRRPANRRKMAAEGQSPLVRAGLGLLVAVLAIGAFAGGGYALWRAVSESPHFNVRQVIVLHNQMANASDVTALLGVSADQNLFKLDLGSLKAEAEHHPWIASVRVYRRLPATLVVDVTEHKPVALLQSGGFFYVSDKGVVFKSVRPGENTDYPIVTGIDIADIRKKDAAALKGVQESVDLLAVIRAGGTPDLDSLDELHWDPALGVTLYSSAQVPVVALGTAPWETKWKQLQAIWLDLEERKLDVSSIEFRSQRMAVLKLRLPGMPGQSSGSAAPSGAPGKEPARPVKEVQMPLPQPAAGGSSSKGKSLEI